ncbi:MAG: hypothetical protein JWQ09_4676 [Segetibacter sp.]|nr:hypothetical protein [Segetibacter sp.]
MICNNLKVTIILSATRATDSGTSVQRNNAPGKTETDIMKKSFSNGL